MKTLLRFLSVTLATLAASAGIAYASTLANPPAVFETYLSAQEGSSDTSFTLASVALRDGTTLSGYQCFTVDANSSSLEYECGTVSGTSVTGLLRGIDAVTGTTSVSALKFTHRRGADVKVTDYPALAQLTRILSGVDTIPALVAYTAGTTCGVGSLTTAICPKSYIDAVVVSGAPNADTSTKGIVQIATALQAASSTATGSTAAVVVYGNGLATSSPGSNAGLQIVMSQNDAKLDPNWLNGSNETYTLAGPTTTFSGRSAIFTNATPRIGIGTSSPYAPLSVVGQIVGSYFTATNTAATSSVPSLQINGEATTTNLTISGACTGCINSGYERDVTHTALNTSNGSVTIASASCSAGKVVTGGGVSITGGFGGSTNAYTLNGDYPDSNTSFTASTTCSTGSSCSAGQLTAYAVCVNQ